jgi:phage host-nuclease inhibitor protein Gam
MNIPKLTESEKSTILDAKKKKRTKKPKVHLPVLKDRVDADLAMHNLAALVNAKQKVIADRDTAVLEIDERIAPDLAALDQAVKARIAMLRAWAEAHPEEFEKDRKSLELSSGKLGFQTHPPSVVLLNRKWTWETALEAVQTRLPNFIRSKPEIDKEAILSQRDELGEYLPLVGLKVAQTESFFVDPDLTKIQTRQTQS